MQKDYDDYDDYDSPPFRWMSVVVLLLAVAGFFSLAWYAYYTGTSHVEYDEVATIEVGEGPSKVVPDDPEGMEFPHQEKTIYEAASDEEPDPKKSKLLKQPEEPVVPEDMPEETAESKQKKVTAIIKKAVKDAQDEIKDTEDSARKEAPKVVVHVEESKPKVAEKKVAEVKKEAPKNVETVKKVVKKVTPPAPVKEAVVKPAELIQVETKKTTVIEKPALKKEAPKVAPKPAPASADMTHLLQLGAYRSNLEAEQNWTRINRTHVSVLGKHPYKIVRSDLGAKGVYYRLRVGGFKTVADAQSACAKLKANKQPCFLVK